MGEIAALRGGAGTLRRLLSRDFHRSRVLLYSSQVHGALASSQPSKTTAPSPTPPPSALRRFSAFASLHFLQHKSFSSSPLSSSPELPNIVLVTRKAELTKSLKQAQEESLPAIFYFTAYWCAPCRTIAPIFARLAEEYPHVTIFKVDIDQGELDKMLHELEVTSVPTFLFYSKNLQVDKLSSADSVGLGMKMYKYYS